MYIDSPSMELHVDFWFDREGSDIFKGGVVVLTIPMVAILMGHVHNIDIGAHRLLNIFINYISSWRRTNHSHRRQQRGMYN
jgi:hypothetical protein